MNWYYVEQGQQNGPVNDNQMAELLRTGRINADTLVWYEGLAEWQPFNQVRSEFKPSAPPLMPDSATAGGPANIPPQANEAVCAECGKIFPVVEMIRHGSAHICAGCKPVFMQKLAEGAPVLAAGELNYASVLTRFAAVVLDGLIMIAVNILIGALFFGLTISEAAGYRQPGTPVATGFLQLSFLSLRLFVPMLYDVILIGTYGATLGKMACKIKVVTADGGKVSYARAVGRYFAKILSSMICLIGYIIAIFDKPQRRALHDHICNTRVIIKSGS